MKRTKRSKRIRLLLIGGLSAGALAGCAPAGKAPLSTDNVYTNNYYVPGVGYYHAPFRAWYPFPYNHFDARTQRYYAGGRWVPAPFESITNVSSPSPQTAASADAMRTDITRGGFGCVGGGHSIHA
ncbi:MAG: hypothetical protein ABSH38_05065 [Verrucomicrobiota bacterium]|jgi:hypothetical protein